METIVVEQEDTLLPYLLTHTNYSRKKLKSLLKYHAITVSGVRLARFDTPLKKKQVISISSEKKATKIENVDILYEDENYLVVNKPAGMLTVSTEKEKNRTLYHLVRGYVKEKNPHSKIFIVHRLDRETSGIVLFAKEESLKRKLQEHWEEVALCRRYTAVVSGLMEKKEDCLVSYLKENRENHVFVSKDGTGKKAVTHYRVLREMENSLLEIEIETGRKNQIRVQLAEIQHPILGDKKYGNTKGKRLYLHANYLSIRHPLTGKPMVFECAVPRDFMRQLSTSQKPEQGV